MDLCVLLWQGCESQGQQNNSAMAAQFSAWWLELCYGMMVTEAGLGINGWGVPRRVLFNVSSGVWCLKKILKNPLHLQYTDVPHSALSRCTVLSVWPRICAAWCCLLQISQRSWAAWSSGQPYPAKRQCCMSCSNRRIPSCSPCTSWQGAGEGAEPEVLVQQQQFLALYFPGHFKSWIVAGLCLCSLELRSAFCWVFSLVDSMTVNCIIRVSSTRMMCVKFQDSQRRLNIRYSYEIYLI